MTTAKKLQGKWEAIDSISPVHVFPKIWSLGFWLQVLESELSWLKRSLFSIKLDPSLIVSGGETKKAITLKSIIQQEPPAPLQIVPASSAVCRATLSHSYATSQYIVQFWGKVTTWSHLFIWSKEILCDDNCWFYPIIWCVKCVGGESICPLASASWMSSSVHPCLIKSLIPSTQTVSWPFNAATRFPWEELFCCAFCEVPRPGPAFSHRVFPLGLFTSLCFTLLLITVHGATFCPM